MGLHIRITRALYSDYDVLKCCMAGSVYLLEEKLALTLDSLRVVPLTPEIPFIHGVAHLRAARPCVLSFLEYIQNTVRFPSEALKA